MPSKPSSQVLPSVHFWVTKPFHFFQTTNFHSLGYGNHPGTFVTVKVHTTISHECSRLQFFWFLECLFTRSCLSLEPEALINLHHASLWMLWRRGRPGSFFVVQVVKASAMVGGYGPRSVVLPCRCSGVPADSGRPRSKRVAPRRLSSALQAWQPPLNK